MKLPRWTRTAVTLALSGVVAVATASPGAAQSPISHCSTSGQNLALQDLLEAQYLWYQFLPGVDPVQYPSPAAYLDAVRYLPLDRTFSYVTSRAANDAFYDSSQFVGFGFASRRDAAELRVLQVFDGSPAQQAGLTRGTHLLEIDGRGVASLLADGGIETALDPESVTIVFDSGDGVRRSARMRKQLVTIPTVSSTRTFLVDGRTVGYLNFRNFVSPSYLALDAAFRGLRDAGVSELVLDLRYNGGGLVDVAVHLGSLIGGARTDGNVFAEMRHNARSVARNRTLRFRSHQAALGLSRLVVITSRASASASELLINALRPFISVVVVGDTTYGKPVGQYSVPICDSVVAPVAFSSVNAQGEGGFFDGIPANCPAPDDIDHALGDPAESSLATALGYVRTGGCDQLVGAGAKADPGRQSSTASSAAALPGATQATGWRSVVNAY